jgi:hypothetical protein
MQGCDCDLRLTPFFLFPDNLTLAFREATIFETTESRSFVSLPIMPRVLSSGFWLFTAWKLHRSVIWGILGFSRFLIFVSARSPPYRRVFGLLF